MDKSVLIIEMPKLSNEEIGGIHNFLQTIMDAFETHYFYQLRQHYCQLPGDENLEDREMI